MSFADAYCAHRTPDGFLKPDVFDGLPHASRVHAQSQRMWCMPRLEVRPFITYWTIGFCTLVPPSPCKLRRTNQGCTRNAFS